MQDSNLKGRNDPLLSKKVIKAMDKWDAPRDVSDEEKSAYYAEYDKYVLKKWFFMLGCFVVALIVMGVALTIGDMDIGVLDTYKTIFRHFFHDSFFYSTKGHLWDYTIFDLRLPRIMMGLLAGAGLAVCGAVMQSTLLNPLADPYTTGVSSGASFGATLAMTAGISVFGGYFAIIGNAFIFSLIPTAVIIFMAKLKKASPTTMIMAGIAVMYIFNALTTVMMLWADPQAMEEVYEWQVGSITKATWTDIRIVAPFVIIGIIASMFLSKKLNLLAAGDDMANSLGINATHMRIINMAFVALITATIVSFTGLIGFVGLVAPHIVRMFLGADNRYLVPAAGIFGAALMIIADTIGRVIIYPGTLQVGVVMSFIGGPMFLWLILRKKDPVW